MISVSVGRIHCGTCPSRRFRSSRDCRCSPRECRSARGRRSGCLRFHPALRYAHSGRPRRSRTSERCEGERRMRGRLFRHLRVGVERSDWFVPFRRFPLTLLVLLVEERGVIESTREVRCLRCVSTSVSISSCSKLVTIGSSSSSSTPPVVSLVDAVSLDTGLIRTDSSVGAINAVPRQRSLSSAPHSTFTIGYLLHCSMFRPRLAQGDHSATAVIHYCPWPPTTVRSSPSGSRPPTQEVSPRMMC